MCPSEPARRTASDRVRDAVSEWAALPPAVNVDDAISAVMCALTDRITAGEAHELLVALPKAVRPFFERCVIHREGQPPMKLDRAEFLDRVAEHLGVTPAHAELVCEAVFQAIQRELPEELVSNVAHQLPRGLKQLWLAAPPSPPPAGATLSQEEARRSIEQQIGRAVQLPFDVTPPEAFAAVMCSFSQRLSGGEAQDLLLALPPTLRRLVDRCMVHRPEPSAVFGRQELVARVALHLRTDPSSAEEVIRATFTGVKRLICAKAARDVASQLPVDIREMWDRA